MNPFNYVFGVENKEHLENFELLLEFYMLCNIYFDYIAGLYIYKLVLLHFLFSINKSIGILKIPQK